MWRRECQPQEPWRTRWPQERNAEQSAPTNAHHAHFASGQLGLIAGQRYAITRGWLWDACLLARVRWGTPKTCQRGHTSNWRWIPWCAPLSGKGFSCKGIWCEEDPTIASGKAPGTYWNRIKCEERFGNPPGAVTRHATINLDARIWKSLEDSLPKMYLSDLTEAYVTQESMSFRLV